MIAIKANANIICEVVKQIRATCQPLGLICIQECREVSDSVFRSGK